MINIGICDDDKTILVYVEKMISEQLKETGEPFQMKTYTSGLKLLEGYHKHLFDFIFLDIDMPEITGLEIANQIRKKDAYVNIIFITSQESFVFDTIQFQPLRFIRKELMDAELPEAIDTIVKKYRDANRYLIVKSENKEVHVALDQIMYIENSGHNLHFVCKKNELYTRDKISNMEEKLEGDFFIRVHKGYLVNAKYIFKIGKEIVLDNGYQIPISRRREEYVYQQFKLYQRSLRG